MWMCRLQARRCRARVTAEIIGPTQSLGTFLSWMPSLFPLPGFASEPNTAPGQAKLELLQTYFDVSDWLRLRSTTLDLYERDEGAYSGTFANTTVPGSYKVMFRISGSHPEVGSFHRTQTLCTLVTFDKADRSKSDLRVVNVRPAPGGGLDLQLRIRPVDRFDNLLGPDYGDQIQVLLSVGKVQNQIEDGADGSYSVPLCPFCHLIAIALVRTHEFSRTCRISDAGMLSIHAGASRR